MAATIVDLAIEVVTELNETTFSLPFVAQRSYAPRFDLTDMSQLHVSVVPRSLSTEAITRSKNRFTYQVDVAIQQKLEGTVNEPDPLMQLVEEIASHFDGRVLTLPTASAHCTGVANDPIYSPEHVAELAQFTSVLSLTFTVYR